MKDFILNDLEILHHLGSLYQGESEEMLEFQVKQYLSGYMYVLSQIYDPDLELYHIMENLAEPDQITIERYLEFYKRTHQIRANYSAGLYDDMENLDKYYIPIQNYDNIKTVNDLKKIQTQ